MHTHTHTHTTYTYIIRVKHLIHPLVYAFSDFHIPINHACLRAFISVRMLSTQVPENTIQNILSYKGIYYFTNKKSGRQLVPWLVKLEVLPFHQGLGFLPSFFSVTFCHSPPAKTPLSHNMLLQFLTCFTIHTSTGLK